MLYNAEFQVINFFTEHRVSELTMEVTKVKESSKECESCVVEEQTDKKQRRWSDLPTGSPKLPSQFLSFSHFLSSLPKTPSVQQTRMWVLSCDFSFGLEDFGSRLVSFTPQSPMEKAGPHQDDDSDEDKGKTDTTPLLKGVKRSHSLFLRKKNHPTPLESRSSRTNDAASECHIFESKNQPLNVPHLYDSLRVATETSCLFTNDHEEIYETPRGKSPEMNNSSSSCSASSSNCFLTELHVTSAEFVCFWNTCDHKEKNTDRLFHHILHSHLHRSTDFRSSRCLWRGCSRDGILKVFNSRHKLLVHVGIHCQKLKEPQVVNEARDQTPCTPQTDQRNSSLSDSMQNLLGLRRLFTFRKSGQSSRWSKQ